LSIPVCLVFFSCQQAGNWGAAPRQNGRGGFQGHGGYQARPPTRYQATGANGTPLGTPQRMSPITVTPPEPSVIPSKPIEAQPSKDSAPAPETTEIKSQKKSKSELKAKDKKVSTRSSLSRVRYLTRTRYQKILLMSSHHLRLHLHHLKSRRRRKRTRNIKSPLRTL